jgi:cell volume regulation protein A
MKSWAVPATAIATLSLIFVLFLDAVQLRLDERANWKLPLLVLGPGTGLTIAIIALAAWILLSATLVQALLLGAILSSTDPVVLRDVIRDQRIPRSIRHTLGIEAGTNDLVVLPIVLILIAVAHGPSWVGQESGSPLARNFLCWGPSPALPSAPLGPGCWTRSMRGSG